ncbi:hypothetical protein ACQKMD_19690 [Viridibacillus sp. NPDC096237]|uniref:hypothetical protein n=1 Tax=Viridibacillus sp. NPDC096237 TaxID=3390721 RepID=UPI003D05C269
MVTTVVYLAEQEKSFDPRKIIDQLQQKAHVNAYLVNKEHGYMNPYDKNFDKLAAEKLINKILYTLNCHNKFNLL